MESLGTAVFSRAAEMVEAMALKDSVDSLPPLRIAALADFMARDAMLAITSGRASKIIRRTPMGQVWRWRMRPESSSVRRSILPTVEIWSAFLLSNHSTVAKDVNREE